jgi:hypothetical protein
VVAQHVRSTLLGFAVVLLLAGCDAIDYYGLEVRRPEVSEERARGDLVAAIAGVSSDLGMKPVALPYGSYSPPEDPVEILCSYRLPDSEGLANFEFLLWVEIQSGALLARAQQFHGGLAETPEARRCWAHIDRVLRLAFPGAVHTWDPFAPGHSR